MSDFKITSWDNKKILGGGDIDEYDTVLDTVEKNTAKMTNDLSNILKDMTGVDKDKPWLEKLQDIFYGDLDNYVSKDKNEKNTETPYLERLKKVFYGEK